MMNLRDDMKMTHYYKFVIYHDNGNIGNTVLFCLSDDDIKKYKNKFMEEKSVVKVEVYRQYISYKLVNTESRF